MIRRLFLVPVALVLTTSPVLAGTWTGKETTKEGVVQVSNPATPSDGKTTLSPQELWRAGGDDEEIIFGVVNDVAVDARGNLYALDTQLSQISVFDPDGNFLRTIGREGEGPGEFRRASQLFVTPENKIAVAQMMPGKIVLLSPDGTPAGNFPVPAAPDGGTQMIWDAGSAGRSVVIGSGTFAQHDSKFKSSSALLLLAPDGTARGKLVERNQESDMANMSFEEKNVRRPIWTASADGKLFINDSFDAYEIKYYGADAKITRVATREYQHRARSAQEMEEGRPRMMFRGGRRGGGGQRFDAKPSPTDPDVLNMFARDDGTVWVMSSRGGRDCPRGTIARFDVFDANGRFVREVSVLGEGSYKTDGIVIIGDRLVVLTGFRSAQRAMFASMSSEESTEEEDEEAEPMAIVCYRLDGQPTAKN